MFSSISKKSTKGSIKSGVPIYVDPIGLVEAEKSMTSTVRNIDLEDLPLNETLPLALEQLDMAYCVRDDILIITSKKSVDAVANEKATVVADVSPKNTAILEILDMPIPMSFEQDTTLEDLLDYIKKATTRGEAPLARRIYADPIGLQEAEKSMTSTVRGMDVEGVPLKTTLRLMLKQLDLAFIVKDGMLVINSLERFKAGLKKPAQGADGVVEQGGENARLEPIFNNQDLEGWKDELVNNSQWEIADGILEESRPEEWHTVEITAIGGVITTTVDGKKAAEFTDPENTYSAGTISLACRRTSTVRFKEVSPREIP